MKTLRLLAVLFLATLGAFAQNGNPSGIPPVGIFSTVELPLLTNLPPVNNANVAVVGNPGNGTYYYWLVTNYTFGQAPVQGPFIAINAPTVLTSGNYVTVTPDYLPGATVDLLKTTTIAPPSGTGSYAVSTGNTSGAISDTGGALSSYTLNPANPSGQTNCLSTQVVGAGSAHLYLTQGNQCQTFIADLTAIGTSTGTLTNLTAGNLSPLFTTSILNPTTTPAITFSLTNAGAYSAFGNFTASSAAPGYSATPILNGLTLNTDLNLPFLGGAGTLCLQINNAGLVGVAGAACGTGGSGITGSGTLGHLPEFTASTAVGNSPLFDNGTVVESAEAVQISASGGTLPTGREGLLVQSTYTLSGGCPLVGTNTFLSQPTCDAADIWITPNAAAAGVVAGFFAQAQPPALSGVPAVTAIYGWGASNSNGSPNYITGVVGAADATPGVTGTIANLTGVEGLAFLQGIQTATLMAGVAGQVQNQAGGNTTPFGAALYARSPAFASGAIVTDIYGLYIADQTAGGGTANPNPFGIYEAGAAPNVLNGSLTVAGLSGCVNATAGLFGSTGSACGTGSFPSGVPGNTVILSASAVGAAVTNTVHSSAFTPGTDLATILAACPATPTPCRVYLDPSNTAIPTTGATIGSATQAVLVIDEGVAIECTGTSGANCISEGAWGSLVCDRKGPSATPSGCTIYTSSSANITSMFTNADHTGAQTDVVLKGFDFRPAAAATIINAAIWLVAVEGKGIIEGNGVLGIAGTNSSCNGEPAATFCDVSIEDGPSTGAFNNLTFKNNAFYGAGLAGNVSINIVSALSGGTGSGSVLTFLGTNVGDGLGGTGCISGVGCAINIDGSTGLAGSCTTTCHFVQSILFDGLYAESTSGQTGNFIEVRNCRDCVFNNVSFNGGPALTTGLSITESAAGRNGRIHIDGFLNGSRATNIVNNAVTGYASGNAKPDFDYTAPGDSSIGTYNDGPTTIAGVATIGASGAGTIAISNSANTFTNTLGSVATANNTFDFPAAVFTNGHIGYCAVTGVICTWTDAGYSYNALPLADHATQTANTLVANVTGSTAAPTAATIPAGVQFYTAGTGYSAATSANLLGVCTTCVTSAAALTSTAIMTGAGSQGSQTPDTTSTLSSGGVLALHTSTIPTFGTGAGEEFQACGTAPTLVASTSFLYCNASNFADVSTGTTDLGPVVAESSIIGANLIPKAIGTNPGVAASSITDDSKNITTSEVFVGGNKVNLTSDFTDSTSGSLVLITGLSYTLPTSKAVNVSFHCMLLYDQGSAAVVDEFGIGVTGTAPTQANASATVYTSTTASTTGTLTALASTTPTLVVSFTPSAITTIWKAELDGTIEQPSNATPGVFSLYAFTTTGSDNLIVKRGSFCTLF